MVLPDKVCNPAGNAQVIGSGQTNCFRLNDMQQVSHRASVVPGTGLSVDKRNLAALILNIENMAVSLASVLDINHSTRTGAVGLHFLTQVVKHFGFCLCGITSCANILGNGITKSAAPPSISLIADNPNLIPGITRKSGLGFNIVTSTAQFVSNDTPLTVVRIFGICSGVKRVYIF